MDDREFEKILASAEQLRLREKQAEPWTDRYSDMNSMEKSMLLDELFALRKADKEERDRLLEKLNRMTEQLMNLNESSQRLLKQNEEQQKIIFDLNELVEKLQKENAALKEQKKQDRKNLYGSKSQKISRKKKEETPSHEENKDDFDGTSGPSSVSASDEDALSQAPEKKEERPYRKVDTEHLCCTTHVRAKFVYAYEQGDDPDVKYLIDCFGELYRLEDTYKLSGLSAQEITSCRHCFIRPLTSERKDSLFFVGSRMANVSAAYHTLLSTCRMNGKQSKNGY